MSAAFVGGGVALVISESWILFIGVILILMGNNIDRDIKLGRYK